MLTTTGSSDCFFMSVRTLEECKRHRAAGMVGEEGGKECEKRKEHCYTEGAPALGGAGRAPPARSQVYTRIWIKKAARSQATWRRRAVGREARGSVKRGATRLCAGIRLTAVSVGLSVGGNRAAQPARCVEWLCARSKLTVRSQYAHSKHTVGSQ